jgi:hypothetical protein
MHFVQADEIIIPQSKSNVILLLLGALAFVGASLWIWFIADTQTRFNPLFVKGIAIVGVVFFALCAFYSCVKVFDGKPGLIIDKEGIVDNSSAVAAGRIPWIEISELRVAEIAGQRFVTILVSDPQRYVGRSGSLRRMLNAANLKMTGSPINISSNSLAIKFDELQQVLKEAFEKHSEAGRTRHCT